MKAFVIASLVASVLAVPASVAPRTDGRLCPALLYGNAVCCATDALGIACLDAAVPPETPRNAVHFREICAKKGQQPRCCVLVLAQQGILCNPPV